MTDADRLPPDDERRKGWDDAVLVWNATVARVRPPTAQPASADDAPDAGSGAPTPRPERKPPERDT